MTIYKDTIRCSKCPKKAKLWKIDSFDGSEPDLFYFCDEHAKEFGFCICCGNYCGGLESFDFSVNGRFGYCEDCWDAFEPIPKEDLEYYQE